MPQYPIDIQQPVDLLNPVIKFQQLKQYQQRLNLIGEEEKRIKQQKIQEQTAKAKKQKADVILSVFPSLTPVNQEKAINELSQMWGLPFKSNIDFEEFSKDTQSYLKAQKQFLF